MDVVGGAHFMDQQFLRELMEFFYFIFCYNEVFFFFWDHLAQYFTKNCKNQHIIGIRIMDPTSGYVMNDLIHNS